jgi:hypothetical protein
MGTRSIVIIALKDDSLEHGKACFTVNCDSAGFAPELLKNMFKAMQKQKFNHSNLDLVNRFAGENWQYTDVTHDIPSALKSLKTNETPISFFDLVVGEVSFYNSVKECLNENYCNFVEDQLSTWRGKGGDAVDNICEFYYWAKRLHEEFELELIGHDEGVSFSGIKKY